MKHNRFLSIFFAGFLFLNFSWSLQLQASAFEVMEDAKGEAVGILDKESGDMIDLSGKTEGEINAIRESIEAGTFKDLEDLGEHFDISEDKFLAADSPEAKAFETQNAAVEKALKNLKDAKLAGDDLTNKIADINTLKGMNRAENVADRLESNANSIQKNLASNLKTLSEDAKAVAEGKMSLKGSTIKVDFLDKYDRMASSMDDEAVGRVQVLRQKLYLSDASIEDIKNIGKEYKDSMQSKLKTLYADYDKAVGSVAQKAIMDEIFATAKDIAVTDALKGAGDLQKSIANDAKNGLGGYEEKCNAVLEQQVKDVDLAVKDLKVDELTDDAGVVAKDAQGADMKMSKLDAALNKIKTQIESSSGAELKSLQSELETKIDQLGQKVGFAGRRMGGLWYRSGAIGDQFEKLGTSLKSITRDDIADGFCSVGKKIKSVGGKVFDLAAEGAKMLVSGVMFMIPNIFQSAFLAQKQRQSELQTLASPIKFGDWVFQIPDSCFNFSNPSATLPIYVRIPVENVDDPISSQMAAHFNQDVSSPTTANPISAAIHSVGATIASFGGNMTARPKRYVTNEAGYLAQNPGIVLAYFANNYPQWGSIALTSSQFSSGQVIDSNGVIIDGSSNQISATGINGYDAYPLQTPLDWHAQPPQSPLIPDNMKDFYATMNSRMALSGDDVKYVEYSTVGSGAAGATGSQALQAAFDCSCLNPESSEPCATGSCAMNQVVQAYTSGCSFDSNLLGSVHPLVGWGLKQGPILINQIKFPGYSATSQATSFKIAKSGSETAQYANSTTNHALLGCWVYLSASTPFAQAVCGNSQSQHSVLGSYVDYIIFLNEQNEQVPLMVPVQQQYQPSAVNVASKSATTATSYGTHTVLAQNPDIKYWTSLASFDSSTGAPIAGFEDPTTGNALKYDLDGSAYADATLAGAKGIIASAINDLSQSFPNLYAQFLTHQAAMQYKVENGPFMFGNVSLTLSDYNLTVPGTASGAAPQAVVPLYQGSSCFGSFEDDLLVALDANNNYLTLPNPSVATFYSLITDVGYKVVSNSLTPSDFSEAALLQQLPTTPVTYSLHKNLNALSTYNVLDQLLESSLESMYPLPSGVTSYISTALDAYVTSQRKNWIANFDVSGQKQGIKLGALTCSLPPEFKTKAALADEAFVYEIVPNLSEAYCDNDLFILTTSSAPTISNLTSPINAENAVVASTYAVSLITGFVFDMQGKQVMNGSVPVRVATAVESATTMKGSMNKVQTITGQIYAAMTSKFDFAGTIANQNFVSKYHDWAQDYEEQMHRPMGPYSFGSLNLGIFAGDQAIGNYVYFPAHNMQNEDFSPTDVFVACQGTFPQLTMPVEFNNQTTYVMSLISGNLYDDNGNIISRLPSAAVLQQTDALVDSWGTWLKNTVTDLQEAMTQRLSAEADEQEALNSILNSIQSPKYLLPSEVVQMIQELTPAGMQGLPAPYGLLKYNSIKQNYVHVSPLSGNPADGMLYLFFDIGTDKVSGKHVGGIYTQAGKFVRLVKELELEVMEKQFGIVVNDDGSQTLGIPLTQPFFVMKNPSASLTLGQNSADGDLISSSSDQFPGGSISMAKGFYLYFSMSMKTYYVYDVSKNQWICCAGNHVYAKNGAPVPLAQKVAMLQSTKSKQKSKSIATVDDMILLYENTHDADQGYMSDGQNYINLNAADESMTWTSIVTDSDLTVTKNASSTLYTVTDDAGASKVYKVSSDVVWHSLFAVPIDEKGELQSAVGSSHRHAQLVTSAGKISHLLFDQVMYKVSSKKANEYLMVPVNLMVSGQITLTKEKDENTGADYVSVFDGKNTYRYLYIMQSLDEDAQDFYRAKFAGSISVATTSFPAGPVAQQTVTLSNQTVSVSVPKESTHVLFVKDIANVTTLTAASLSAVQDLPTGSELEILTAKFTGNVLTAKDGRFFVAIAAYDANNPATFSYVSNGAYVDLYTGVLFDTKTGISLGYCLNLDDWLSVLNNVGVSVIPVSNSVGAKSKSSVKVLALRYRSSTAVNIESAQLVADAQAEQNLKEFVASVPSLATT